MLANTPGRRSRSSSRPRRASSAPAVRERGDRRERVVQLMADDADHPLPGRHLLARELAGHAADQAQPVRPALQAELALRKVEGFLAAVDGEAEEAVLAAGQRLLHGGGQLLAQRMEVAADQAAALGQQLARGNVGDDDALLHVGQQQGHGRVLHDGVEQQLALGQVLALFAQRMAQFVVQAHQLAELVLGRAGRDRHAVVAVAVAEHGAFERTQQALERRHPPGRQPDRQGQQQGRLSQAAGPPQGAGARKSSICAQASNCGSGQTVSPAWTATPAAAASSSRAARRTCWRRWNVGSSGRMAADYCPAPARCYNKP